MGAMRHAIRLIVLLCVAPFLLPSSTLAQALTLTSPDERIQLTFSLTDGAQPTFTVSHNGAAVAGGTLGMAFTGAGPLLEGLRIVDSQRATRDESYSIPVGKTSSARDHHHELRVALQEIAAPRRRLDVVFRAFDDGIAFRYVIPQQDAMSDFVLTDEHTHLHFAANATARVLPLRNYTTPYEWYYQTHTVADIPPQMLIGMPMLVQVPRVGGGPLWLAVTEANLTDYAGMYLSPLQGRPGTLTSKLSPLPGREDGAKVIGRAPHASPWRILMIADDPGRLIESNIIFNVSEPSQIADTSWIRPGKTTFPWWNGYALEGVDFEPGVNTATMKHYIDFCAEQGIPYHSLDGLDIAWYGGPIHPKGPTDITTAAPSIDLAEVLRYAKQKGVRLRLWMHWKPLQEQIDRAFALYEQWGIEGVMVDFMDRDDQEMVRFYHEMAEKAARHHLTITFHGAYKPTGMERTWPNVLSYEAVLNQEYNKWEPPGVRGTPPEHNLDAAFIRMLAGPLDYHQGGMRSVLPENYKWRDKAPPVQGTRGHQIAMYVVYQNHLSMMADYPAAYRGEAGLDFMVDVPANWDQTRVLHAELGKCIVIARRRGEDWYIGGMTAAEPRELKLPLDFVDEGDFKVDVWLDDPGRGPNALDQRTATLSRGQMLEVAMPASGGFAARLKRQR